MDGRPQRGLGGFGRDRFRSNLGQGDNLPESVVPRKEGDAQRPFPVTPWAYPDSSRVKAYQYDYGTGELRMAWANGKTPWIYENVPVAVFEAFDASDSKGRFINSTLNFTKHHPISSSEHAQHFKGL